VRCSTTPLIIGEIAEDTNVDYDGTTIHAIGGAVYYSGFAAANMGHKIAVLPKADTTRVDLKAAFAKAPNITVYPVHSTHSFVTKNVYHTPDRERRTSTVDSVIDPYKTSEVPAEIDAKIWHLAGLVGGDITDEMIPFAAERGAMVAIDVQTMLRCVENGGMVYHDWAAKREMLPYIRFLKTDAAEAEILTGTEDRAAAARMLYDWGAKEVLITHNSEVLVYDGKEILHLPHQGQEPVRPHRPGRHHLRLLHQRAADPGHSHRSENRHRAGLFEDGDPRPHTWAPGRTWRPYMREILLKDGEKHRESGAFLDGFQDDDREMMA